MFLVNHSSAERYALLKKFILLFLGLSLLLRLVFSFWIRTEFDWQLFSFLRTLFTGMLFDLGVLSFFTFPLVIYLAVLPNKWVNSLLDKIIIYGGFAVLMLILSFTFFAEITFWDEFKSRFNFIAVDYLIYTYEVVKNIQESYSLPLLISGVLVFSALIFGYFYQRGIFKNTLSNTASYTVKIAVFGMNLLAVLIYGLVVNNNQAEWSNNRYNNEVSKAGIYSFFAAFRSNHLDFSVHYSTIEKAEAFDLVKSELNDSLTTFYANSKNPLRRTIAQPEVGEELKPNVIFVLMESMSASFMKTYGNEQNLTPNLDSLHNEGLSFTNMYANGTRTVRGMEAVTLSIPPTPGNSIVKRPHNANLYTISNVFKEKGYTNSFFYGGDGYFDNMNAFYGGNGFTIYDRGRGSILSDKIKTTRHQIANNEVTFENAWGISDEDIFAKEMKIADQEYAQKKPFFHFVMTTSNHKPYSYPEGKIDIPSGTGRDGAVKYADYAVGQLIKQAKTKPWFKNTVFIFIADHCASSAGKDEIDVKNHHIPAIIYNLPNDKPFHFTKEVSQIDLFPTLFARLNWAYTSQFYGRNVFDSSYKERSFVGTYIKLGYKENNKVMILSDQQKNHEFLYDSTTKLLMPQAIEPALLKRSIAYYQTADYLFQHKLLNEKHEN